MLCSLRFLDSMCFSMRRPVSDMEKSRHTAPKFKRSAGDKPSSSGVYTLVMCMSLSAIPVKILIEPVMIAVSLIKRDSVFPMSKPPFLF